MDGSVGTGVLRMLNALDDVPAEQWDRLAQGHPFMQHAFLRALHASGCAASSTGWRSLCLTLTRKDELVGAMLLYLKSHSRGEYVFDHGWADAYHRNGLDYYPKLLCAVPFTPVSGPRLMAAEPQDKLHLARAAIAVAQQNGLSSVHVLFPDSADLAPLEQAGYLLRRDIQFHWKNESYAALGDFLHRLSKDKRKKILQDRKRVTQAGVRFEWLTGDAIDSAALDFFYHCYETTYYEHGNAPYLTRDAFERINSALPGQLLLVRASMEDQPVACALNVVAGQTMYGRYWGSTRFVSGLHFETCYTQSIEYCIAHGLACFEGGAQGEHKMARGLRPAATYSAHWVDHPDFARAIEAFLAEERAAVSKYQHVLDAHSPFKIDPVSTKG